ncbi:MAG: DUF2207 domain-containing protein [Patescibacteria group bacterium]
MKKVFFLLLFFVVSLGGAYSIAQAQNQTLPQEAIVSFVSNIAVNTDNSIEVAETIVYNTGPLAHHGIYRDIYLYSSQNRKIEIQNVSVTDETGNPYMFQISDSGSNFQIKIGDPNTTFTGQKTYVIRYLATKAMAQFDSFDEIYWNVTGNDWGMPIYQTQVSVVLPLGTNMLQSSCYYGPRGSTNQCGQGIGSNGVYSFNSPSTLNPGDGITVAVGFPKGFVTSYFVSDAPSDFLDKYWRWLVAAILPILTLIFSLLYWHKKGRDAKGTGTIIPQYEVPNDLTPVEVGGIVNEKVKVEDISSEIIYLATKGYLKISQLEKKFIGLIKQTDYELTKLKESSDLQNDFDKNLMDALFKSRSEFLSLVKSRGFKKLPKIIGSIVESLSGVDLDSPQNENQVRLSQLKNHFYYRIPEITEPTLDALLNKGYYKNLGRMKTVGNRIFLIGFMSIWASLFFGGIIGAFVLKGNPFPMMVGIFLSIIIYAIISYFSPAKTEKGTLAKEHILGLKEYLQIAEKDRLEFHNAPEKKPKVFENLLPYAMVLGVADVWAKEFEGMYTTPPSWYSGPAGSAFSAMAFAHSMSNLV